MRVAIVENTAITHHGQIGVALHERAAKIDLHKPFRGEPLPPARAQADALVVFGGEQSARDDASHPYLPALADLIRAYVAQDLPVLGICLGAQVMARAFGATNHLGTAREFGWCDVTLTEAGRADPLFAAQPAVFPIFQWHSDTFSLPEGAVHLAQSPVASAQAFRIGRAGYATRFHFEASRAVVADWSREFPELTEANAPGWHRALPGLAATRGAEADGHGLALARAWVGLI
ncbi:type 1 glutamine amidotransferase [Pseudogemmobacter sonorensis]|uniref:type 1 glutamine amidotransferase n=1 Tax=Pseudogemmobacter sonorensis TaxID=2989681 RepID=UPI0036B8167C